MKLKPIKYPTLNAVKRYGLNRTIVSSPAGSMEVMSVNWYRDIKGISVSEIIEGDWQPKRTVFNMDEEGYAEAKKLFEEITHKYLTNLISQWLEE